MRPRSAASPPARACARPSAADVPSRSSDRPLPLRAMRLPHLVARAPTLRLETPRLSLRRFREGDAATALLHEQDRRIMQWIRDPQPEAAMRERIAALQASWQGGDGEWLAFVLTVKPDDA